jgi:hypothetical protein
MDIASVFDWFARDSIHAAAQINDPKQRAIFLKLAEMWAAAAQRCRDETATPTPPSTPSNPGDRVRSGGQA